MEYRKLAHVTAADMASVESGEIIVVNLKGRILTAAQVAAHLDGTTDGETVER